MTTSKTFSRKYRLHVTCVKLAARIFAVAVASAVRAAHGRNLLWTLVDGLLANLGDASSS
jgi:hypothetical protein